MFAIWVFAQHDRNRDEVAEGWVHDCDKVMQFDSVMEAQHEATGLHGLRWETRVYDGSDILTDA